MSAFSDTGSTNDLTKSNIRLTDHQEKKTWRERTKRTLKRFKQIFQETTVEPCLFTFMFCTAMSSMAVQTMHLEKSCRVNLMYSEEICDRLTDRNTTGLEKEINNVQSLVARVIAWKFPLQTSIPALAALFIGAWSDKYKKRKICLLFPFIGEITTNIGLLLATYYFRELSLTATALIEALPPAFTGSYIIMFLGMYSFLSDRTTVENRTFRLGIASICVSAGTPAGTALSGIALRGLGYYGVFSLLLVLNICALLYGLVRLKDIEPPVDINYNERQIMCNAVTNVFKLAWDTIRVAIKPREFGGRLQIFCVILLYLIMVGPLYGDSQVAFLYAIRKFNLNEVEYSIYGTINILLGLIGTYFCISVLSKTFNVQDSALGGLAGVSRIASCFVLAFATNKTWYYSAPLFNIFSSTGLAAVRSISTKAVPIEEVAKFSALLGLTEALAPSIYMPTSSFIYVSTIEDFPGAFYLFDAALTMIALILFGFIYIQVKKRNKITVTNPDEKEHYSRTNEISRF